MTRGPSSTGPWSIKGIDSRARERAREKARRDGLTLGQYMNRLIMDEDSAGQDAPRRDDAYAPENVFVDRYSDVIAEVDALADRLRTAPSMRGPRRAAAHSPRPSARRDLDIDFPTSSRAILEDNLAEIIDRLNTSERGQDGLSSRADNALNDLRATQDALRQRLEALAAREPASPSRTMDAMRALEGALSRLAQQMEETHHELSSEQAQLRDKIDRAASAAALRSDDQAEEVDRRLKQFESGANESQRRIDDSLARLTQEADRISSLSAKNEKRLSEVEDRAETAYETSRTLSRELGGRVDAVEKQAAAAETAAGNALSAADRRAEEMRQRLQGLVQLTEAKLDEAVNLADAALARSEDLDQRINSISPASMESVQNVQRQAREALDAAEETSRALVQRLNDAQDLTDRKIGGVLKRADQAVADAVKQSSELSERIKELSTRIDDVGARQDEQLQDVLESTANAIRAARTETRDLSERLTETLEKTQSALADAAGNNEALAEKLTQRIGDVENRFNASQQNVAAIMGRVSELGARADKDSARTDTALETLKSAVERINERMDQAEKSSEGAIKSLEDSFSTFEERLDEVAEQKADAVAGDLRDTFQQSMQGLSDTMSRSLQETRDELERQITETAQAAANTVEIGRLEERIGELQSQISDTENRQAEAIEVISTQLERMSTVLDDRLRDVEDKTGGDIDLAKMREDIARLSEELDERIGAVEAREGGALEAVAKEVAQMADSLEDRVKDTESRSANAIEQIGEQVVRVAERIQSRQDEMAEEFDKRLTAIDENSQSRLDDALEEVSRRLDEANEAATTALGPVQNIVASLARRTEALEDMDVGAVPPPFTESEDSTTLVDADADDDLDISFDISADDDDDDLPEDHLSAEIAPPLSAPAEDETTLSEKDIASSAQQARREFAAHLADTMNDETLLDEVDDLESDFAEAAAEEDFAPPPADDIFAPAPEVEDDITPADLIFDEDDASQSLPSAFGHADEPAVFGQKANAAHEFEASLPSREGLIDREPEALREDRGSDDDPFARSSVNSLDFLSAARRAALERGDDNQHLHSYGAAPIEEDRRGSKLPWMMAGAGAIAMAVAGGAVMRGKHGADDYLATPTPDKGANGQLAQASPETDQAGVDQDLFGDDVSSADPVLFADASSHDSLAPMGHEAMDTYAHTASVEPAPMIASAIETPTPQPSQPRKVSALEAFATPKSQAKPKISLEQAAQNGDPIALHDLALKHLAEGEKKAAADAMTRAAEKGLPMAQYRLAKLYERGEGVPRSVKEARIWTEQSAKNGNVKAMHDLAVFFAEGEGGQQSYVGAVEWFTRAANHGLLDSQYNLGVLYERGLGVSKNLGEAALWFDVAGKNGDADAARRARDVMNRLSPNEADTARRRASLFSPLEAKPEANGVFGAKSWEAPARAQVLEVQRLLNMLDYNAGPADGLMGARTRAAISRFQADRNLPITGEANFELLDILRAQSIGG